jgi:adenylyltransferase/sulfurtransferase
MAERYGRQIIMPDIGKDGQEKLAAARVLVIGAGGLGSPVLYYLAAAGVGHIHIVESDSVDITNLNRQFLHFEKDIGREKSLSAAEKLTEFNSGIEISSSSLRLTEENARECVSGYDLVISCVDNLWTRILLNKSCVESGVPLVDGGVQGFEGYVLTVIPGVTPCRQCIFPGERERENRGPIGILGSTAGVAGSIMAAEAVKYLTGIREDFKLLIFDLRSLEFTSVMAKADPLCPVCGNHKMV